MATQTQDQQSERDRAHSNGQTGDRIANGLGWFSIALGLTEIAAPRTFARWIGVADNSRTSTVLRLYGMREVAAGLGILSNDRPVGWLWARVAGDLVDLSSLGKAMASDSAEKNRTGLAAAAVAGVTALDLYCAQRLGEAPKEDGASPRNEGGSNTMTSSIIIDKSAGEIYAFWRNFQNLSLLTRQLESVEVTGTNRSHWKMRSPLGHSTLEWDAEITEDRPDSYLAWRSLSGSAPHSGSISFTSATGGRGTKVTLRLDLNTGLGSKLGKLLGAIPQAQATIMLHNLKQLCETGEVVQSDASVHAGPHPGRPPETYQLRNNAANAAFAG